VVPKKNYRLKINKFQTGERKHNLAKAMLSGIPACTEKGIKNDL